MTSTRDLIAAILGEIEGVASPKYDGMQFAIGGYEYAFIVDRVRDGHATATLYRDTEDDLDLEVMTLELAVRVTSITDRTHPDYDPTDADLAPRWDAIPVDEQHAISRRLQDALEAGAL